MKSATRKYGMAIAQTLIGVMVGSVLLIFYWFNEPPPYTMYDRVVLTPRVEQGGIFRLQIKVRWTKSCYSKLYRNIIDSEGRLIPFEREVRPNMKGFKTFEIEAVIPKVAAAGPARWEVRTEWFCNPIQRRWPYVDNLDPIFFEIVPAGSEQRRYHEPVTKGLCMACKGTGP